MVFFIKGKKMKFKVRAGYLVTQKKVINIDVGGQKKKEIQTNTFYAGQDVDLEEKDADLHLHKLEPVGADAKKFIESKAVKGSPQVQGVAASANPAAIQKQIDDAVAAAVADAVEKALSSTEPVAPEQK